MILNSTNDRIIVRLENNPINQLHFYVSYNIITSTSLTPTKNLGSTSGTTAVIMMPSPSSNQQHQLSYCSIYNRDSSNTGNTVTIELSGTSTARTLFSANFSTGDIIQYTRTNGWQIYNYEGLLENVGFSKTPTDIRELQYFNAINTTGTATITADNTMYAFYLGIADKNYNLVSLAYNVTTAVSSTNIRWAQIGIYKGWPEIGQSVIPLTICGFVDVSFTGTTSNITSTGNKNTSIPVTGVTAGDNLYVLFGSNNNFGTGLNLRSGIIDDLSSGVALVPNLSAFSMATGSTTVNFATVTQNYPWLTWQGFEI